jgi:hypothetical protein
VLCEVKDHHVNLTPDITNGQGLDNKVQDYKLNFYAILMAQMLGKGVDKGISVVAGWFGLPFSTANYRGWKETEDLLGKYEKQVTEECCLANLQDDIISEWESSSSYFNRHRMAGQGWHQVLQLSIRT